MKQIVISDQAHEYLCNAGRCVKEAGGQMLTFGELVDLLILAAGGSDWC